MDGIDLTFRSVRDEFDDAGGGDREEIDALASAKTTVSGQPPEAADSEHEPVAHEEVDALLAAVPVSYRVSAVWAIPLLVETARGGGITHPRRLAYVLATAHHSAQFGAKLVENGPSGSDRADRYFERFEPGTPLGTARGNSQPGDGERFRGRGFVYVKGRASYATWSHRLGLPDEVVDGQKLPFFVAHPEIMARPDIAAQTLVRGMRDGLFTGIALGYYVNDKKTDYYNARRVIDGTEHARDVAELASVYQAAIEGAAAARRRAHMQDLAERRAALDATRDLLTEVRDAVERLARHGEILSPPTQVSDWNGEARQGKFVQLDDRSCALHVGRGVYVRLDVQRDLNGVIPPEGKNMALKRSGEVRPATRSGESEFWR